MQTRLRTLRDHVRSAPRRGREWSERQDPASSRGVAIGAWRRYQSADGPLQSALLSLYILVAILPAVLVMQEYLDSRPGALADRMVRHFGLNRSTGDLLRDVLVDDRTHKLGSALFAIAGALIFGLNFGRVLQHVHARAWQIPLVRRASDQALYAAVLLGLYGLILLLLVQLTELRGSPEWARDTLALGWIGLLSVYFVWAPWQLTRRRLTPRDLFPGALLTAFGLVALMLISSYVMEFWVNLYARDYGGLGVVLAIYFWILFSSGIIVWAAAVSPALADRRELRRRSSSASFDGSS